MQGFAKNDISNILMLTADWRVLRVSENTWSIWKEKPSNFKISYSFFFLLLPASVYLKETNELQ